MSRSFWLLVAVLVAMVSVAHVADAARRRSHSLATERGVGGATTGTFNYDNITTAIDFKMPSGIANSASPLSDALYLTYLGGATFNQARGFTFTMVLDHIYAYNSAQGPGYSWQSFSHNLGMISPGPYVGTEFVGSMKSYEYTYQYAQSKFYSGLSNNDAATPAAAGQVAHNQVFSVSSDSVAAGADGDYTLQWLFPPATLFVTVTFGPSNQIVFNNAYKGGVEPFWTCTIDNFAVGGSDATAWGNTGGQDKGSARWWFALQGHPDKLGIGLYQLNQWKPNDAQSHNQADHPFSVSSDSSHIYINPKFPIEGLKDLAGTKTMPPNWPFVTMEMNPNNIVAQFAIVVQTQDFTPPPAPSPSLAPVNPGNLYQVSKPPNDTYAALMPSGAGDFHLFPLAYSPDAEHALWGRFQSGTLNNAAIEVPDVGGEFNTTAQTMKFVTPADCYSTGTPVQPSWTVDHTTTAVTASNPGYLTELVQLSPDWVETDENQFLAVSLTYRLQFTNAWGNAYGDQFTGVVQSYPQGTSGPANYNLAMSSLSGWGALVSIASTSTVYFVPPNTSYNSGTGFAAATSLPLPCNWASSYAQPAPGIVDITITTLVNRTGLLSVSGPAMTFCLTPPGTTGCLTLPSTTTTTTTTPSTTTGDNDDSDDPPPIDGGDSWLSADAVAVEPTPASATSGSDSSSVSSSSDKATVVIIVTSVAAVGLAVVVAGLIAAFVVARRIRHRQVQCQLS